MKGSPLRELALVVIAGLLLLLPLRMLTRQTTAQTPPVAESEPPLAQPSVTAWLDARFSHSPERVELVQGDRVLWRGEGGLREDGDVEVIMEGELARLELRVEWPESVAQGYAEFTLELEGRPARSIGFWGKGTLSRNWNVRGESRP